MRPGDPVRVVSGAHALGCDGVIAEMSESGGLCLVRFRGDGPPHIFALQCLAPLECERCGGPRAPSGECVPCGEGAIERDPLDAPDWEDWRPVAPDRETSVDVPCFACGRLARIEWGAPLVYFDANSPPFVAYAHGACIGRI